MQGEDAVHDLGQHQRVLAPGRLVGKARVVGQIGSAHRLEQQRRLLRLVEHGQNEPAAILGAVVVSHGVRRVVPVRTQLHVRPQQRRLAEKSVHPHAVRHQAGRDVAALAGLLPPVEAGHDRAEQRRAGRMIAHARQGAHGSRARRAHHVHHAGAGVERRRVEAGALRFRPLLTICGQAGVDQPVVQVRHILVHQFEFAAHGHREVGDQHICLGDQPAQDFLAAVARQIQAQASLRAVVAHPGEVAVLGIRHARPGVQRPEAVAAGGLDLDHVGAEIGQDGGGDGGGDETGNIQHHQPVHQSVCHERDPLRNLFETMAVSRARRPC